MKRTVPRLEGEAREVARGELIGRAVRVAGGTDAGLVGLSGIVVDETLRTLVVRRADGRELRIGKAACLLEFEGRRGPVQFPGAAIEFRPAERTKKVR